MHILVLGSTGQVGGMLIEELPRQLANNNLQITTAGRSNADVEIDFTTTDAIMNALSELKPDVVINAIAYTAVDKAESEPELAHQINAKLPGVLAEWCLQNNVNLIHYSTDFVFNGESSDAYVEADKTAPLSVYGESKLAGEKALLASAASSVILRTSWVYGETGQNFMLTMQRFARERESLGIVADQRGTPTYSRHLAILTCKIINAMQTKAKHFQAKQHIYHASAGGETTWHGFATEIFKQMADYETILLKDTKAISTADYPTPARRPANSVLNCDKLVSDLGLSMPDWQEGLAEASRRAYSNGTD